MVQYRSSDGCHHLGQALLTAWPASSPSRQTQILTDALFAYLCTLLLVEAVPLSRQSHCPISIGVWAEILQRITSRGNIDGSFPDNVDFFFKVVHHQIFKVVFFVCA